VHVSSIPATGAYVIDKTQEGDSIIDVLGYVQFPRRDLLSKLRARVEEALDRGETTLEASAPFVRKLERSLDDYTYLLERPDGTKN
jgi:arginine decarboxylase-like protein